MDGGTAPSVPFVLYGNLHFGMVGADGRGAHSAGYSAKWQSAISGRLGAEDVSHVKKDHVSTAILFLHPPATDLAIRSLFLNSPACWDHEGAHMRSPTQWQETVSDINLS